MPSKKHFTSTKKAFFLQFFQIMSPLQNFVCFFFLSIPEVAQLYNADYASTVSKFCIPKQQNPKQMFLFSYFSPHTTLHSSNPLTWQLYLWPAGLYIMIDRTFFRVYCYFPSWAWRNFNITIIVTAVVEDGGPGRLLLKIEWELQKRCSFSEENRCLDFTDSSVTKCLLVTSNKKKMSLL